MISLETELNDEQRDVVLHGDGPCLVLAGAGSGKTRVITYRVAYLLEKGIPPDQIFLATFTNKAAHEMTDRVRTLTVDDDRGTGGEVIPWSGTFHHLGCKILRSHASVLQYRDRWTILDSDDATQLMKECVKRAGIDRNERRFPSPAVLASVLSFCRNAERPLEQIVDEKYPQWFSFLDIFQEVANAYAQEKRDANVMDFDDLLVNTKVLLETREDIRKKYQEQFRYLLVDEYQDTNAMQASIISLLGGTHRNVLVVGDDAQSIYSFRAADIRNILSFESRYPDAKIFRLVVNYRSTPDILNVANSVIARNREQYQKKLRSVLAPHTKPMVRPFADEAMEATYIAEEIQQLRSSGIQGSGISVLFRAAFHSQALELELTKRHMPYDYRGGLRFFERAHVKDVLAFLRLMENRNDRLAWQRVLRMQTGIGPAVAERIVAEISNHSDHPTTAYSSHSDPLTPDPSPKGEGRLSIRSVQVPTRALVGWNDFLRVWDAMEGSTTPREFIDAVIHSSYADYLEREYPDARECMEDLEQLAVFAGKSSDVHEFLSATSLGEQYAAPAASTADRIVLSTVHQAKGLEWDAVFVMRLAQGQFPSDRAFREAGGVEEERRLFYVAATRAKKYLYFTHPLVTGFGASFGSPSMFLDEIDEALVDRETLDEFSSGYAEPTIFIPVETSQKKKFPPGSFLKSVDEL